MAISLAVFQLEAIIFFCVIGECKTYNIFSMNNSLSGASDS